MKTLIKQPNGKYCSADYRGEAEFLNYTEQDIINLYIEKAKEDIKNAEHYEKLIANIEYGECCRVRRNISDKDLQSMGFDKPYSELVKFVPRRPLNQTYASCDFTTYGKCPNCSGSVQDGMGHKDEKCGKCGQLLEW